ncbi:MAG: aminotransferase class V-fold PLP-dependent enzyme [Burkholderiales bacterium]|nr:aminotransferase class V-fold PLP-dependent enzyme [Burkholderiales bacterium]
MPAPPLPSQRHLFDLPLDVAFLNCGTFGPFLRTMPAAGIDGINRRLRPWSLDRESFYVEVEEVRSLFARILETDADDVALVPSSSYAVAVAAANIPVARYQNIVVPALEHSSNFYAWQQRSEECGAELRVVPRPADGDWTTAVLTHIDAATALVAVPNCHWSDGSLFDLVAIGDASRTVGAALVVDATQSIGALPFDLSAVRPDFIACSGYKWLLCPYGLSFLYAAPHRQNGIGIELHSFNRAGARNLLGATFEHLREFEPGARRYDMGERSNFITLPMAKLALEQILSWSVASIAATLTPLTEQIAHSVVELGLGSPKSDRRAGHIIGLSHPTSWPADIEVKLQRDGVHVALRGDRLRISPHLYSGQDDIDRLMASLRRHLWSGLTD